MTASAPTNPPSCDGCERPLTRVLEQPYGFWQWYGGGYDWQFVTIPGSNRVAMFVCGWCMTPTPFHPQDVGVATQDGVVHEGGGLPLAGATPAAP